VGPSIPLRVVDAQMRQTHVRLASDDECYFLREYVRACGYAASETNSLILNLKKSPQRRGLHEWRYKEEAIQQAGQELRAAINPDWLKGAVLVPIPPSKAREHPEYDDRMARITSIVAQGTGASSVDLLQQLDSTEPLHLSDRPRDPESIVANLVVDDGLLQTSPARIGVFDDLLTTGAHFRAARSVLGRRFPSVQIIGFFIARRIVPDGDAE
jgi:predicted amidophosphoribosyltransferase